MFFGNREEVLNTIQKIQREKCVYDMGFGKPPNFCDCKYGYDNRPYNEKTSCPELRCVIRLLENITDKEYEDIIERK